MRRAVSFAVLAVFLALSVACDDGDDEAVSTSTATVRATATMTFSPSGALAVSPPFAGTPAPTSTPLGEAYQPRTTGWAVFLRDDDLRIARLDGSDERALTSRGTGGGYAGVATHADGTRWMYLTVVRGTHDEPMFAVLRQPLDGGPIYEVFAAAGRAFEIYRDANVAISGDGRTLLYPDADGIVRRDLGTGAETRVIDNYLTCPAVTGCYRHRAPRWSPDGSQVTVQRFYYEGSRAVLIDTASTKANARVLFGHTAEWSPDGDSLCAVDDFFAGASEFSIVGRDGVVRVTLGHPPGRPELRWVPRGCAWSRAGLVATTYGAMSADCNDATCRFVAIVVMDERGAIVADLTLPEGYASAPKAWLAEDAILFALTSPGEPRFASTVNLVITLDGRIAPFAIPYGDILAVIQD